AAARLLDRLLLDSQITPCPALCRASTSFLLQSIPRRRGWLGQARSREAKGLGSCASMPSGKGALSSAGSVGIWPVTNSQPPAAVAWLNGATGVGASAT